MKKLSLLILTVGLQGFSWTHLSSNIKGWTSNKVEFYVNYDNCTLPESTLNEILDAAINAWNGVPHSNLEVSRSTTPVATTVAEFDALAATRVPVIICDPNMAQANVIPGVTTNTRLNSNGNIVYSGILLNANLDPNATAEISRLSRDELEVTIAHEIGHALGLGHSSDQYALMYYMIGDKTALLTQDDMDGVAHIYPRSEFSGGTFGCSAVHRQTKGENFYWFWIGLLLVSSNVFFYRLKLGRLLSRRESSL